MYKYCDMNNDWNNLGVKNGVIASYTKHNREGP